MKTDIPMPESLLEAVPHAALVLDTAQDQVIAANRLAMQLLAQDSASGFAFAPHIADNFAGFLVCLDELAHRGRVWRRDIPLQDQNRHPLHCELRGTQIGQSPHLVMLTLIDLNEMLRHDQIAEAGEVQRLGLLEWQRAQAFFSELERQNQLILNAAGEGIYGVNADGKTTFVNRAAREMLGWSAEDLLGRDIHSMIHHHHLSGEAYPAHDCPIYQSFRYEQVNRIEDEVFWRKDGKPIRVEYVSTPIYDQNVLAGAVVIFRDITERKENERKLRDAMTEVQALREQVEQENAYLQEAIASERAHHEIIGSSPAIQDVLSRIERVAGTEATVLISGEAGTGKALVASAIHKDSARRRRSLIHFKCSAVTSDAIEAELFGHIRGAFPGALRDRPGMLELAHNGTLFLDDVDELPLSLQGRLLHALQEGSVTRLGDTRAREISIRVIAASRKPLETLVRRGQFREELFMFLNVFPITCQALRERREDIPPLAAHFLTLACKRLNTKMPTISRHAMEKLISYHWPGNVRELQNVIDRSSIISTGGKLQVDLAPPPLQDTHDPTSVMTDAEMTSVMRANIVNALRKAKGKVAGSQGAADMLMVQPTTLYSRIKKLRIQPEDWL
ncbi:PAS domain S-box-containing protein [Roseinatronobacter thiooxidans]|uniref:Nif-specific regulatory protein n=2 Tax=Roseinatronobacter thiooxidans TaxID=121821 RepID=A0A2W7Q899_9RHOB|nr:sigma 54-interacting transcriptional regulator [Roseinatronobacter thiooxidans]PZX42020.1 PAS domain S-box-containing protein [Roseinatronobacter thiooxidans]